MGPREPRDDVVEAGEFVKLTEAVHRRVAANANAWHRDATSALGPARTLGRKTDNRCFAFSRLNWLGRAGRDPVHCGARGIRVWARLLSRVLAGIEVRRTGCRRAGRAV